MGPVGTGDWGLGLGLDNKLIDCSINYMLKSTLYTRINAFT